MKTTAGAILAIKKPSLSIREMALPNIAEGDPNSTRGMNNQDMSTAVGNFAPYIEIGNYRVMPENITSFSISQTGFLPELTLSFLDKTGAYRGQYHPNDLPLQKVYIKSQSPVLKPYRADFLITNSVGISLERPFATGVPEVEYTLTGELYVEGLYETSVEACSDMTSYEALSEIASRLKLGFATNESSTNDKMTWLNPNWKKIDWIKQITAHAYKNEKSFFTSFIDVHYHLNFINVEFALSRETDIYHMPVDANTTPDKNIENQDATATTDDREKNYDTVAIQLSVNSQKNIGAATNAFEYTTNALHGEILKNHCLQKEVIWYDSAEYEKNKKALSFYFEPNSEKTDDLNKFAIYQKPLLENFTRANNPETVTRWLGVDYKNVHQHYKFSKLINSHNLEELKKNYVTVKLPGLTNFIIRGSKISMVVHKPSIRETEGIGGDSNFPDFVQASTDASKEVPDVYLSAKYYVVDLKYEYNPLVRDKTLKWTTELTLARREWIPIHQDDKIISEYDASKNNNTA